MPARGGRIITIHAPVLPRGSRYIPARISRNGDGPAGRPESGGSLPGMRTLGKILGIAAIIVLVLAVVLVSFGAWTVHRPFPQLNGEITVAGLEGSVEVVRDDLGIPQIYADSIDDLFFAEGYVHAQDRFYEMDVRRHITAGRLSEMFGDSQVETDKVIRTMGWRRVAEQEYEMLSAQTRQILEAYARGVNAYVADQVRAGVEPGVLGAAPDQLRVLDRTVGSRRLGGLVEGAGLGPWRQHGR